MLINPNENAVVRFEVRSPDADPLFGEIFIRKLGKQHPKPKPFPSFTSGIVRHSGQLMGLTLDTNGLVIDTGPIL